MPVGACALSRRLMMPGGEVDEEASINIGEIMPKKVGWGRGRGRFLLTLQT